MPTTNKPPFYGTTWFYCGNFACPMREVVVDVKDDRSSEATPSMPPLPGS